MFRRIWRPLVVTSTALNIVNQEVVIGKAVYAIATWYRRRAEGT